MLSVIQLVNHAAVSVDDVVIGSIQKGILALVGIEKTDTEKERVQVVMQADNDASKRVAEKCGFVLEATLKKYRVDCLSKQPADDCIFVRFDAEGLL